jgi:hypothetical protein
MSLSISLEVTIPDNVPESLVISIGAACYPEGIPDEEPMDVAEALQWAFLSPWGVDQLHSIGVEWNAQHQ